MKISGLVIVLAVTGGALWIEHGHHVVIDAPVAAEALAPTAATPCPDNDTMPYDARCLEYLNVSAQAVPRARAAVAQRWVQPAPCPDSDKVPYSASCIAFLKGATETGMRWRVTDEPASDAAARK
jgi:hypothetical protein